MSLVLVRQQSLYVFDIWTRRILNLNYAAFRSMDFVMDFGKTGSEGVWAVDGERRDSWSCKVVYPSHVLPFPLL